MRISMFQSINIIPYPRYGVNSLPTVIFMIWQLYTQPKQVCVFRGLSPPNSGQTRRKMFFLYK